MALIKVVAPFEGGFKLVDEKDFDEEVDKLFVEGAEAEEPTAPTKKSKVKTGE